MMVISARMLSVLSWPLSDPSSAFATYPMAGIAVTPDAKRDLFPSTADHQDRVSGGLRTACGRSVSAGLALPLFLMPRGAAQTAGKNGGNAGFVRHRPILGHGDP